MNTSLSVECRVQSVEKERFAIKEFRMQRC